ncbi:MAG: DNA repair protein RadA [Dehalococcoidia bacterium]|uniref:DNA repair protein RadA n=1 Tax=Candidatus Amarobacter glycogenicus TaxID=3140699 RepID=UPI003135FC5E|nr:DNA repair protein RadA [Dehalococcoidia bacterium]MBK6561395.1 DNA repair protein RadA [Dehalococcoidia bacterium]MBK9343050.1 DNA repair protein RadA [Dehalococcoidia bacterium]MCC6266900.1 DNA repair protein RadA [Dehalococcoidia bacterium]
MARAARGFRCRECGWATPAYVGRCAQCQAWNTLDQFTETQRSGPARSAGVVVPGRTVRLADVPDEPGRRLSTEIPEFDRVLGGGLVPGSLVLVGGDPGIGKSTLMLQAAARLAQRGTVVAYVCGEESPRQVRLRATRLGVGEAPVTLIPESSLDAALAAAEGAGASVVIIDSIQSVYVEGLDTRSGGPAQLSEAGARLVAFSKTNEITTIVTGHVTKSGEIAGPRLLEHLVDAVLYFENAEGGSVRVLRAIKNRFGATDEVGVFEMTGEGLQSVENPSSALLESHDADASGCAVTAVIEGSRPLALEVQALAVPTNLASPRRIASGLETSRLHLLLAVLARRGGVNTGAMDVVASVSGGMRLRDTGADLAILAALASAASDQPLPRATACLGEVALSGAVRPVHQSQRRLAELSRVGFKRCLVPNGTPAVDGIVLIPVRNVRDALQSLHR